jgi:hypothetical protein
VAPVAKHGLSGFSRGMFSALFDEDAFEDEFDGTDTRIAVKLRASPQKPEMEVDEELNVAVEGADTTETAAEPAFEERSTAAVRRFNVPSIWLSAADADFVVFLEVDSSTSTTSSWNLLRTLLIAERKDVAVDKGNGATPELFLSPPAASTAPESTFSGRFRARISASESRAVDADACVSCAGLLVNDTRFVAKSSDTAAGIRIVVSFSKDAFEELD